MKIMNSLLTEERVKFHLIFLFILSLYYLIPYFLVGQLILYPHDVLDIAVVFNHVMGKIYHGDFESINLFLAGEIKWYFLRGILQPITLLYAFFKTEVAFWLIDIFIKLISYICFFKLSRKLHCSYFNSALIACVFASSINYTIFGLGMAILPYIFYLMIKNKNLNLKHYCLLTFFGLNIDLANNMLLIPLAFFVTLILNTKYQTYNFKLFIKIASVLIFFILLSNSNLIYAQIFSEPSQRTVWFQETPDLVDNFYKLIGSFFVMTGIKDNAYFFHHLPFALCFFPIILVSLFSKNKKSHLLLLVIFLVLFIDFLLKLEFVNSIRNNSEWSIKTLDWSRIRWKLPVLYGLLFINIVKSETIKKTKYLIYPLIFLSLIIFQIRISIVPLGKHFLSFNSLNIEQQSKLKKSFTDQKYSLFIKDIIKFNKNKAKYSNEGFKSSYTFKGYYDYENYKYIKSLVGDSRTMSIGLDPMVAVMNNIKVIDGYHIFYPLNYKLKFRKIIEKQLDLNERMKKYYDYWGERVYTFVSDPKVIKINFVQAKHVGAEYVISKYSISNEILIPICESCNESPNLFLYKIEVI